MASLYYDVGALSDGKGGAYQAKGRHQMQGGGLVLWYYSMFSTFDMTPFFLINFALGARP